MPGRDGADAEIPIPGPSTVPGAEKNLCRSCGYDFGSLSLYDSHRELWKITRDQRLIGRCRTPQEMALILHNGVWYTSQMLAKYETMRKGLKK